MDFITRLRIGGVGIGKKGTISIAPIYDEVNSFDDGTGWIEPDNWDKTKAVFFKDLPPLLRAIVPNIGRKSIQKQLQGHGMGKHSTEEIYAIGIAALTALSDFLADKTFFFGDEPTSLDASAYEILANILGTPFNSPIKNRAQQLNNIVAYCDRGGDRYYPISPG